MDDLVTFLGARLAEKEMAASRAQEFRDKLDDPYRQIDQGVRDGAEHAWHEAAVDPARMLRDVAADRAIMAEHAPGARFAWNEDEQACQRCGDVVTVQWPCSTIRQRVSVYSDHPDYRQEWKP